MTRIRWVVAIVFAVVTSLGVVMVISLGNSSQGTPPSQLIGHVPPSFTLTAFDGSALRLDDYAGKVVIVNWWNEWCQPCIDETPSLLQVAADLKNDPNVAMIGIVHDERTQRAARDYAASTGIPYPLAFDPGGRTALDWGVSQQPETFIIAPNGKVQAWIPGPIDVARTESIVASLEQR